MTLKVVSEAPVSAWTGRAAGTRVNPGQATGEVALPEAASFARAAKRAGLSLDQAQGVLAATWLR